VVGEDPQSKAHLKDVVLVALKVHDGANHVGVRSGLERRPHGDVHVSILQLIDDGIAQLGSTGRAVGVGAGKVRDPHEPALEKCPLASSLYGFYQDCLDLDRRFVVYEDATRAQITFSSHL
jgi:hypothetical protein